jgi:hypothetical protein
LPNLFDRNTQSGLRGAGCDNQRKKGAAIHGVFSLASSLVVTAQSNATRGDSKAFLESKNLNDFPCFLELLPAPARAADKYVTTTQIGSPTYATRENPGNLAAT